MTNDLTTWLRAQLDEDERVARRAGAWWTTWTYDRETFTVSNGELSIAARKVDGSPINDVDGEHIACHDPARVLAEVDAKRSIVGLHVSFDGVCTTCRKWTAPARYPCDTLLLLALPYADRPGYRDEWRP